MIIKLLLKIFKAK